MIRLRELPDDQLDAALRAGDPAYTADAPAGPDRGAMLTRVLEATTSAATDGAGASSRTRRAPRAPRATRRVLPIAAAALAVATVGAFVVDAVSDQPAGPGGDLVLAAQQTESAATGRVVGSVEVREAPGIDDAGGWDFAFTYAGGDFRARIDEGVRIVRAVGVGETLYTSYEPGGSFAAQQRTAAGKDPSLEEYLGVAAAGRPVDGLVSLLERTSSVTQRQTSGGITYLGTVDTDDLQTVGELPPGASYLAGATAAEAPDTITVEADVIGDRLTRLDLELVGPTSDGPMDITITTRYSSAPDGIDIAAPSRIQPEPTAEECRVTSTGDGGTLESPGCADLVATVDRFYAENPDSPCLSPDGAQLGTGREFVQCLREEGFDDVADAWATYLDAYERMQG